MTPDHRLRVRFTEPAEFLDELKRDRDLIERKIVRLSKLGKPSPDGAATAAYVVAGAIVAGRPVVLERYIGDLWGITASDNRVQRDAGQMMRELRAGLAELELDERGGMLGGGAHA